MSDRKPPLVLPTRLQRVAPLPVKDDSRPASSLVTFLLPRLNSAAPVHREILLGNQDDKRRAISSMSEKKNDEMRDRHDKILWMTRSNDAAVDGGDDNNCGPSLFASLAFASFGHLDRGNGGEMKKRVSLMSRVKKSESRHVSYIESSLKKLRTDAQLRDEFFRAQQQAIVDRTREAREAGASHRKLLESELRELTPERTQSRLQSRCSQRDAHITAVQDSKKRFISARQMHREELVERARSLGLALHDPCEVHRPPPGLILWWSLALAHMAAAKFHAGFRSAVTMKKEQRSTDESLGAVGPRRSFYTMKPSVGVTFLIQVQAWWKGMFLRRLLHRRRAAASIISKYFRKVPKIPFQFRYLMKSLLRRVSLMQAHYRAVRLTRMMRRNQGVALVNKKIRVVVASIDEDLARVSKKKKQAESQHSAAIKARKPLFEAEIRDSAIQMTELARRKQRLLALTDASKFTEVSRVVYQNESEFREMLRQYGLALFERYMISVNIQRVYQQKMTEYSDSLRRRSLSNIMVPSISSIRKEAAVIPKPVKPVLCVALEPADVDEMLQTTLLERADADLEAQTTQHFGKEAAMLANSSLESVPPSRGASRSSKRDGRRPTGGL